MGGFDIDAGHVLLAVALVAAVVAKFRARRRRRFRVTFTMERDALDSADSSAPDPPDLNTS